MDSWEEYIKEEVFGKSETQTTEPEPEVELPELVEVPAVDQGDGKTRGMKLLSKLTNRNPKVLNCPDHLVPVFTGYDGVAEEIPFFQPDWQMLDNFSYAMSQGLNTLLVGPPGPGKTTAGKWYSHLTGRPFIRIDFNFDTDRGEIIGMTHITNGDTEFVPGEFPRAIQSNAIVCMDEILNAPPNLLATFMRFLDSDELALPELKDTDQRVIKPHEDCLIFMTSNHKGDGEDLDKHPMAQVQDAALRNRIQWLIKTDYADMDTEQEYIENATSLNTRQANQLAKFSFLLHEGYKKDDVQTPFSYRQIQTIGKMMSGGMNLMEAIRGSYVNFCAKSELKYVHEAYVNAFGNTL
jgi:hypothetical protein